MLTLAALLLSFTFTQRQERAVRRRRVRAERRELWTCRREKNYVIHSTSYGGETAITAPGVESIAADGFAEDVVTIVPEAAVGKKLKLLRDDGRRHPRHRSGRGGARDH